ncbi:MAG: hypothetical protein HYV26_21565 [Candidatus Hydrogenedentes bacterium]|nr:hypothetical protein [Candidatus Hydrogenedentota bacterium]
MLSFIRNHKIITVLAMLVLAVALALYARRRGPHHGYELDFVLPAPDAAMGTGPLEVGVAKRDISPVFEQYDDWRDENGNGRFDKDADTYTDRNGDGNFDGVWMAGFNSNRPAKDMHDPLWVRALALRNNGVTLVLVTLDSIGIFHNEFVTIRKRLDPSLHIDHVLFSCTHNHETPDTMKIWSGPIPVWGFQPQYVDLIQAMAQQAIEEAVRELQPVDMTCASVEVPIDGFVDDSRKPQVIDQTMYLFRFTKPGGDETVATFVNWGNHAETLGGGNSSITSDFAHYLRQGLEQGVPEPNGVKGFGGMCLYFQGQIGGLMTQLHTTVPHRDGQQSFKDASFEKAESLGYNLAILADRALRSDQAWKNERPLIAVAARTIKAPLKGMFKYAIMLGLIHEGYYLGGYAKTEINALRIGDILLVGIPGEIYPEMVEGGVEALPGRDFEIEPQEVPPLRQVMEQGPRLALVIGLANDEIGYMVPKSQWDTEEPYVYEHEQYGEENSGGPDVALTIHHEAKALIESLFAAHPFQPHAAQ